MAAGDAGTAAVGRALLEAGGSAVDAAVGAMIAAFVYEPPLTGPFGGGFALTQLPGQAPVAHDFFATVPGHDSAAKGEDFEDVKVFFGPASQIFHIGRGAAAVPLLLPGLIELHRQGGRLPLAQVVAPAVEAARAGVRLSGQIAGIIEILAPILGHTEAAARRFTPGGQPLQAGALYQNQALADFLERFGQGQIAQGRRALLQTCGRPDGALCERDFEAARPGAAPPLEVEVRGRRVLLPPPPSVGGLLVAFGLELLKGAPAASWADPAETARQLAAAMALTTEARRAQLDPKLKAGVPLEALVSDFLSPAHLDEARAALPAWLARGPSSPAAPEPPLGGTTHVSVVTAAGEACTITTSNGEGNGWLVKEAGVMANNFLGEEDLHPYGFHLDPPGHRLVSMMCPTLVLEGTRPVMALGSGGSNRIRTALLQVLGRVLLGGQAPAAAVHAPRIHLEGDLLYLEGEGADGTPMAPGVPEALRALVPQQRIFPGSSMFFGGVHLALRGEGAADPRRGGVTATTHPRAPTP